MASRKLDEYSDEDILLLLLYRKESAIIGGVTPEMEVFMDYCMNTYTNKAAYAVMMEFQDIPD